MKPVPILSTLIAAVVLIPDAAGGQATPTGRGVVPASAMSLAGVTGEQLVSAVDRGFPGNDVDHDGMLDRSEFGRWMVPLKAQSDPSATAGDPHTQQWLAAAFDRADSDGDHLLSKAEVIGLLSQARQG